MLIWFAGDLRTELGLSPDAEREASPLRDVLLPGARHYDLVTRRIVHKIQVVIGANAQICCLFGRLLGPALNCSGVVGSEATHRCNWMPCISQHL